MEITIPEQLAALSHPKRLELFRLLVRHYPEAVAAGEIAKTLSLKANTASVYLTTLRRAGLIRQTRIATSLHYSAQMDTIRALFGGLMAECCQNRPDLCLPGVELERRLGVTSTHPDLGPFGAAQQDSGFQQYNLQQE